MHVSQTGEYALRAMAGLAMLPPEIPVRAADLAEVTEIPSHYLAKVLRRLVLANLLISQKGQGGGFLLTRAKEDISFMDILLAVDAFPSERKCAFGWKTCSDNSPCPLHSAWSRLNDRLSDWANNTTLADVVDFAELSSELTPLENFAAEKARDRKSGSG